ncbi:MAG: murein biosynthesis integral membrane protein MurJ, partial [Desulfosarcinaceae bacterium]
MNQPTPTPPAQDFPPAHGDITRAAGVVGSATLLSRILGYVRDVVIAGIFGTGMAADAFFVAFSIPDLLRRLFVEGSLGIAFVPVFSRHLVRDGLERAADLANSALRSTALVLAGICGLAVLFAPYIVEVLAYGWLDQPEKINLCIKLTRIMLPYGVFICLVALCMGVLNVLGHFAAPALSPVLLNTTIIAAAFLGLQAAHSRAEIVLWVAAGVLFGGIVQLVMQIPFLLRKGIRLLRPGPLWHPGMKKVVLLLGPVLFGTAIYQINSMVIRLFASMLPQGSVSYLYYADRLVQFPMGIFGMAAATAVLPALSRQAADRQWKALGDTFNAAMRLVFFMTLPSMVGLIVLRGPIVALLFQRGAFNAVSTRLTADALLYYGIGLWAFSAVRIVLNAFYALQETWTPVRTGLVAVAVNALLCAVLMKPMQHNGLALALSLSSMVNLALLTAALRKRLGSLGWRKLAASFGGSLLCALTMGSAVWALARWLLASPGQYSQVRLLSGVGTCILAGGLLYAGLALTFQVPEMQTLLRLMTRKK